MLGLLPQYLLVRVPGADFQEHPSLERGVFPLTPCYRSLPVDIC